MKNIFYIIFLFFSSLIFSQNQPYIYGSFESNSQLLQNDQSLDFISPEDNFRSNNYFQINYQINNILAGIQYEGYLPSSLLGFYPELDNQNKITNYFIKIQNEKSDITVGSFYEQFGNGLIFRSWEDRQLGINNAIKGIKLKYYPSDNIELTALYGQQRDGFNYTASTIQGLNTEISLNQMLNLKEIDLSIGSSIVNRYQENGANDSIPSNVSAYGGRLNMYAGDFSLNIEGVIKDPDVIANENNLVSNRLYDGTALQVDLGYSKKGIGINTTFRRLENFNFYSDRLAEGNIYNQKTLSFTPTLSKQQDYLLTNIYVYNSQPRLVMNSIEKRSGEVGFQNDFYYTFDKDNLLGKYKTKIAFNFSYWSGIESTFNQDNSYDVKFIGNGDRYYRDLNLEIKNRWNSKLRTAITFLDVIIDKGITLGGPLGVQGDIKAKVGVIEANYLHANGKSSRGVLQHLWTKNDRKNWLGLVYEYGISSSVNVFVSDGWNYGRSDKIHYYNLGGSYSKNSTRVSLNYGRQRGGLICIGGVCRYVPESNGFNLNLSYSF
jgi:hypothetical protein